MKLWRNLFALALAGLGLWALLKFSHDPLTPTVRKHMEEYIAAIESEFGDADPVCLRDVGPFPINPKSRFLPFGCTDCETLVEAKLIRKDPASGEYVLDKLGKAHYQERMDPRSVLHRTDIRRKDVSRPRLCFGQTRVHALVEALPAIPFGSQKAISVRIIPEIRDPAPFLFTAEARALGLPEPKQEKPGAPWLLPPQIVSFITDHGDKIAYFDNSLRYGKWINEK
mgnify:FL=1